MGRKKKSWTAIILSIFAVVSIVVLLVLSVAGIPLVILFFIISAVMIIAQKVIDNFRR